MALLEFMSELIEGSFRESISIEKSLGKVINSLLIYSKCFRIKTCSSTLWNVETEVSLHNHDSDIYGTFSSSRCFIFLWHYLQLFKKNAFLHIQNSCIRLDYSLQITRLQNLHMKNQNSNNNKTENNLTRIIS